MLWFLKLYTVPWEWYRGHEMRSISQIGKFSVCPSLTYALYWTQPCIFYLCFVVYLPHFAIFEIPKIRYRAYILYSLNTVEITYTLVDLICLARLFRLQVLKCVMCHYRIDSRQKIPVLTSKSSNCKKPGKFNRNKLFIRIRRREGCDHL